MVHRFVKLIFFHTFKQARNKVSKLKVPWKVLKRTEFDFSLLNTFQRFKNKTFLRYFHLGINPQKNPQIFKKLTKNIDKMVSNWLCCLFKFYGYRFSKPKREKAEEKWSRGKNQFVWCLLYRVEFKGSKSLNKFPNKENLLDAKVSQWRHLSNTVCMNINVLCTNKFNPQRRLYKKFKTRKSRKDWDVRNNGWQSTNLLHLNAQSYQNFSKMW